MHRRKLALTGLAALVALALACSQQSPTLTSPSASTADGSGQTVAAANDTAAPLDEAAADGSTLKVTAPTPQSPVNDQRIQDTSTSPLTAGASTGKFGTTPLQYRFQVFNASGAVIQEGLVSSPSFTITTGLDIDARYTWRVRAEAEGAFGPWSTTASFLSPEGGYIRGNELYDPLYNGKTVGVIHGPVTFIPGVGVKLNTLLSHISYQLPQTLTEGEFSILVTNMPKNTEGGKTKLFAMSEGYSDLVTNDRRMTVEKRGDPPGIIAWRFITHDDVVDTVGPERRAYNFQASETYFWEASWRNNFFKVLIREGGVDGRQVYNFGKHFAGRAYDPSPHVVFIGAPEGRSGPNGASVEGAVIRQVWVSSRPRPEFASR